jgi:hypothetical protein
MVPAAIIFSICAFTSFACALLLLRAYWQRGPRLLLWSGLCFLALTADNVLVILDLLIFPNIPFILWRNTAALIALVLLIYGLVWDAK